MSIHAAVNLVTALFAALCCGAFSLGVSKGRKAAEWTRALGTAVAACVGLWLVARLATLPLQHAIGPIVTNRVDLVALGLGTCFVLGFGAGQKRQAAAPAAAAAYSGCALAIGGAAVAVFAVHNADLAAAASQLGLDRRPRVSRRDAGTCIQQLHNMYQAFSLYVSDWDALPPAAKWQSNDGLTQIRAHPEWLHCPQAPGNFGYAYNSAVAGRAVPGGRLAGLPGAGYTALLFDSGADTANAAQAETALARPGRHDGRDNVLYCDGHIAAVMPH